MILSQYSEAELNLQGADQGQTPKLVGDDVGGTFQSTISPSLGCESWSSVGCKNLFHERRKK